MTELEQIAASVAKALDMTSNGHMWITRERRAKTFAVDGRDIFDPEWQARCRDWLLERGYITFETTKDNRKPIQVFFDGKGHEINLAFPAAEFCARAIHELMKDKPHGSL